MLSLEDLGLLGLFLIGVYVMLRRLRPSRPDPTEVSQIIEEAELHVREGRREQALELLELALKHHQHHPKLAEQLQALRDQRP